MQTSVARGSFGLDGSGCEVEVGLVALAGGAEFEQGAGSAVGFGEGAEGVGVELDEGVVIGEDGGVPGFGDEAHEAVLGGGGVGARGDAEALDDAEVVGVDGEGAAAEGAEVDDGGGDLGADAFELFEPGADLVGAVPGEEVEGEGADAGCDLLQDELEARCFLFGEGDDGDDAGDVLGGGVAEGFPVIGAGVEEAMELAHGLLGGEGFGAGGEKRVDELGEGVRGDVRGRLAVVAEEETMDVGELVGLLGGERGQSGLILVFGGGRHGSWMMWGVDSLVASREIPVSSETFPPRLKPQGK